MEVILLEKIGKLGNIGDKAKVKAGFGRNYLIPQGKAVFATESNIAEFESRRAELEAKAADALTAAQARADQLAALDSIVISVIAGDEGKLFGSIGARELEDAIGGAGVEVSKNKISLPDGALRQTGDYVIDIQLHSDVTASVSVTLRSTRPSTTKGSPTPGGPSPCAVVSGKTCAMPGVDSMTLVTSATVSSGAITIVSLPEPAGKCRSSAS